MYMYDEEKKIRQIRKIGIAKGSVDKKIKTSTAMTSISKLNGRTDGRIDKHSCYGRYYEGRNFYLNR
jgi:hypothetical protein